MLLLYCSCYVSAELSTLHEGVGISWYLLARFLPYSPYPSAPSLLQLRHTIDEVNSLIKLHYAGDESKLVSVGFSATLHCLHSTPCV